MALTSADSTSGIFFSVVIDGLTSSLPLLEKSSSVKSSVSSSSWLAAFVGIGGGVGSGTPRGRTSGRIISRRLNIGSQPLRIHTTQATRQTTMATNGTITQIATVAPIL